VQEHWREGLFLRAGDPDEAERVDDARTTTGQRGRDVALVQLRAAVKSAAIYTSRYTLSLRSRRRRAAWCRRIEHRITYAGRAVVTRKRPRHVLFRPVA
jgi:hypothetical protein